MGPICLRCALGALAFAAPMALADGLPDRKSFDDTDHNWCAMPAPVDRAALDEQPVTRSAIVGEVEPNNLLTQSQLIPISMSNPDVDLLGYNAGIENDYYAVSLQAGDILGVAVLATGTSPFDLDPQVTIFDPFGNVMVVNDDAAILYPFDSPFPITYLATDSAATVVAPYTGAYRILVQPFTGYGQFSEGPYTLQMRIRRNPMEGQEDKRQVLFLDFNGATINPVGLYGFGNSVTTLSPLVVFLPRWGLTSANESQVIDAVLEEVERNFAPLAAINPEFDVEIRNSRDHPDPVGEEDVTRVIVGGTIFQLGIETIGIASSVDPGNFDTNETAVVLLDYLSDPDPTNAISINNTPRAPNFTIIDAIGRVLGNIIAHEAGHTFGNWHTEASSLTRNIMDAGASTVFEYRMNVLETGIDEIMGTSDDNPVLFTVDSYANEGVGSPPASRAFSDVRTAYGLSAGPPPCPSDFLEDDSVNGADLSAILSFWSTQDARGDLTGDGVIDGADLALLLSSWGPCP